MVRFSYLAAAAVLCVACASAGDYVAAGLRHNADSIEKQLSTHTPLGSSYIDVVRFINNELKHEGGFFPARDPKEGYAYGVAVLGTGEVKDTDSTFSFEKIPEDLGVFDEMKVYEDSVWIDVLLGRYWGIPFEMWVSARYKFDRAGTLVAIEVQKDADAL